MIEMVISQRRRSLGGFEVGRVLPFAQRRMVGPFIFFDHLGPLDMQAGLPRSVDVRPHPHIGLSTVTYLFAGEIMHRDSVGSEQAIHPAEINWMTAGSGVTHSERFERARREGDHVHGLQAWVALPKESEEISASFHHYTGTDLPVWQENGTSARLLAGEAFGAKAKVATLSPLFYIHWTLAQGTTIALPDEYSERAAYVAAGRVTIEGRSFGVGEMILFSAGSAASLTAEEPSLVMGLGGEPLGERFLFWNFVSSSKARLEQAKADWRAGRMKLPDLDHDEFIPLPEEPSPAPNPMS
ncbi:pirin family protein [Beijerinckia indica]|uniref:Pirin domain protein n=1 Tax=Beijerinckia indica subsp. indica (strain ATCC 9039 / DSM 1715 / NCIMB 8712) TaxID=395963 RepID=B2IFZ7_BEII9|nr:pirin family protein [Beijerinckia indica]ACB95736.1 Pirin domain protein [Beijerinckia indica subsp. indica ATCC 9039]